jgi:hypothetical protein
MVEILAATGQQYFKNSTFNRISIPVANAMVSYVKFSGSHI